MSNRNPVHVGKIWSEPNEELYLGGYKWEKEEAVYVEKSPKTLDGRGEYKVINPHRLYCGKSYSDWTTDWFNWFLSADADNRNLGPVVFLRSHGLPDSHSGANPSHLQDPSTEGTPLPDPGSSESRFDRIYVNDPNVRIGSDRLQIFEDQAVFVPIIVAYKFATVEPFQDWGRMQDYTGLTIDYGDNPPGLDQLTINNRNVELGTEMSKFRIVTPIFPAVVPDTQYGRSVKDFLEDGPFPPGSYPAMVEGYFVILTFSPGTYWVHSWASAPRERKGPYFSELLYQIEVGSRTRQQPNRGFMTEIGSLQHGRLLRPSRNERVLSRTFYEKKKIGELTGPEMRRFQMFLYAKDSPFLGFTFQNQGKKKSDDADSTSSN